MSVKRVLDYQNLLVDESMGADITSAATNILFLDRVGYQLVWTGTPNGTFYVQVSNDSVTWADLTLSTPVTASGSGDNAFIDIETGAKYVRLFYDRTSGTGTLDAYITGKSISG